MEKMVMDVTALSSKGQVVIPKNIRKNLNLSVGTHFIVISEGENILLKPIVLPNKEEYERLMKYAQDWAESSGMKPEDIDEAVKKVRLKNS